MTAAFLDSNVLLYTYAEDVRSERTYQLLSDGYVVGVQTLNEFAYAARRKLKVDWPTIVRDSVEITANARAVISTELVDHQLSMQLAAEHQLALFDALMLAIALRAGCTTFCSEDMQHGFVIHGQLTITNPFI